MSTSKYNATSLVVDDRDSSITYSSGWLKVTSAAEYMQTRTGADTTGMTAIFSFRGEHRESTYLAPRSECMWCYRNRRRSVWILGVDRRLRTPRFILRTRWAPRYPDRISSPHYRTWLLHRPHAVLPISVVVRSGAYARYYKCQRNQALCSLDRLHRLYTKHDPGPQLSAHKWNVCLTGPLPYWQLASSIQFSFFFELVVKSCRGDRRRCHWGRRLLGSGRIPIVLVRLSTTSARGPIVPS